MGRERRENPPSSAATPTVATGAFAQTTGSGRGRGAFMSMASVTPPVTPQRESHSVTHPGAEVSGSSNEVGLVPQP